MKKINLLCAMLLCTSIVFAQQTKRVHPDRATHYIKGNFSAHRLQDGTVMYTLDSVSTEGISFEQADTYNGVITDLGDLRFTFDSARTTYPGGFTENDLAFWFYDKEIGEKGEWQPDMEIRQAAPDTVTNKITTMILTLDCSSSLGYDDFHKVIINAKDFLQQVYAVAHTGNVRIGIIAFSSMRATKENIFSIKALDATGYPEMTNFLDGLDKKYKYNTEKGTNLNNGTALYYALDIAVDMTKKYVDSFSAEEENNYALPMIITFTDGIDQTSQKIEEDILSADQYYKRIIDNTLKQTIDVVQIKDNKPITVSKKIHSWVVSVKGSDITSEKMEQKFDGILSSIATSPETWYKMARVSELKTAFTGILNSLFDSWSVLNCYVPAARQGLVCWTMGEEKKVPKEKPAKEKTMLLGLNVGGASPLYFAYDGIYRKGFDMTLGLDFAYPITQNFALGFYVQSGLGFRLESEWSILRDAYNSCYYDQYNWEMNTGLLMTMGDMRQKNAFLLGLGAGILGNWYAAWSFNMRLGFVNHTGVYMSFDLNTDFGAGYKSGYDIDGNYYWNTISYFRPAISIGYNFGALYDVK